jgi:Lipocalin-like domain
MEMRGLTSAFILTVLLLGMPTWANAQMSNQLFGTWRVTSFKLHVIGESGERDLFGPNPKGYVILTPEPRIMAFIAADGRQPPANQAEAAAMLQSMIAYTGRIKLEPDKFTTDVEFSWNQLYIGKPQVRFYIVDGDKLTLLTPEQESATVPGERITSTLTFERQK